MNRRRTILFAMLVAGMMGLQAQVKDASTVYSEFSQWSSVVRTASPQSEEYEQARQAMLQLFPQLNYHAALYAQQKQIGNAMVFAKAYVDIAMMPQFQDLHLEQSEPYSTMTYFLASNYYNRKDYTNAITYLSRYLQLDGKNRAIVYLFLAKSYEFMGDTDNELATLESGLEEFPTSSDMLALSINVRMGKGWYAEALPYVERAIRIKPDDQRLVSLKGQCLEGMQRYEEAAGVYELLAQQQKSLKTYKHYAINLYNCAVQFYPTDKTRALDYFHRVIPVLQQVVANDPTSVLYTNALAMAYLYTDDYDALAGINDRLRTLGAPEVNADAVTRQQLLASDLQRPAQKAPAVAPKPRPAVPAPVVTEPAPFVEQQEEEKPEPPKQSEYRQYVQTYVEKELHVWQQKDPFETIDEYKNRVTEQTRNDKVAALIQEAKRQYLGKQEEKIKRTDFELMPYDAENKVFLIRSKYGDLVLPVPRENNEARNFAANWKEVFVSKPVLDVSGDEVVIRSVDFVTRTGQVYNYTNDDDLTYSQAEIAMQFDQIDYSQLGGGSGKKSNVKIEKTNVVVGNSDVDINIPESKSKHDHTFAFLIGNEHYQQVSPVPFALHDAEIMKQYCHKALGIPESNIRLYKDATFGKFLSCMREIRSIADAYSGNIDIVFYYAGHGVPDEASKSAYLLPVDADATQPETCFPVGRLYHELGQLGAKSVVVLMDACFSGSQRGEGMLASARGVALKAKPDAPQGRMVTLSAATGEETAYPYEEQQHGMFTYYVLKCLQESKGRTSLGDLADYVQTQVKQRSVVINHKSQTPTVNASAEASDWRKWNWK